MNNQLPKTGAIEVTLDGYWRYTWPLYPVGSYITRGSLRFTNDTSARFLPSNMKYIEQVLGQEVPLIGPEFMNWNNVIGKVRITDKGWLILEKTGGGASEKEIARRIKAQLRKE